MQRSAFHVTTAGAALALAALAVLSPNLAQADTTRMVTDTSVSTSSTGPQANGVPSTARQRRAAKKLALEFYVPFETGDTSTLDQVLSTNWLDEPLGEGQQAGRDGFKPVVAGYRTVFPDLKVSGQVTTVSVDARTVTVRSTFTGTQRAAFLGVPATGRTVSFRTTDVHRIRHGRIVETWHLEDLFGVYQQLIAGK